MSATFGVAAPMTNEETNAIVWFAGGGAMLTLLRSIVDGSRRSALQLIAGCVFGAAGAALAGYVFHDSKWVLPLAGASAVMTEHVILGLFNASKEFSDHPIEVFARLWRLIVPTFTSNDKKD